MDAVAGQKVQDATAVPGEQLGAEAALILNVHAKQVQQRDPLRVNMVPVV
jgi:hypothetical protein